MGALSGTSTGGHAACGRRGVRRPGKAPGSERRGRDRGRVAGTDSSAPKAPAVTCETPHSSPRGAAVSLLLLTARPQADVPEPGVTRDA